MPNILATLKQTKTQVRKHLMEVFLSAVVVAILALTVSPSSVKATIDLGPQVLSGRELELAIAAMVNDTRQHGSLPQSEPRGVRWSMNVPITAYASVPEQTDDTPFITANGTHVYDGTIAANFLPFGTRVRIPDLYGQKEFVVEDRMNARYHYRMDIWMADNADAKRFGVKYANVEILDS